MEHMIHGCNEQGENILIKRLNRMLFVRNRQSFEVAILGGFHIMYVAFWHLYMIRMSIWQRKRTTIYMYTYMDSLRIAIKCTQRDWLTISNIYTNKICKQILTHRTSTDRMIICDWCKIYRFTQHLTQIVSRPKHSEYNMCIWMCWCAKFIKFDRTTHA